MSADSPPARAGPADRALCYGAALGCAWTPEWLLRACCVLFVTQALWLPCARELRAAAAAALAGGGHSWAPRCLEGAIVAGMAWMLWTANSGRAMEQWL